MKKGFGSGITRARRSYSSFEK